MDFSYKLCLYEKQKEFLHNNVNIKNLTSYNFEPMLISGETSSFLEYLSLNKVDIVVINLRHFDIERFSFVLDIIYDNFCKNILLLSDGVLFDKIGVEYLAIDDFSNFDLRLEVKLMDIKRKIQNCPSKNLPILKSKISNMLDEFQFSSRHDGFKYYIDAVILAYMKQPYNYSTMQLYKDIACKYGKSFYAVEKSMRTALIYAFNKLKSAPQTEEYNKLRTILTYDLNNNTCISMMLNRLMMDDEIKEDLIERNQFMYRK